MLEIDPTDPRLTEDTAIDYTVVIEGSNGPEIALRYQTMSHTQQRYILALWRAGEHVIAQRIAGCYRSGTLFQTCLRGAYARGFKHRCGDPFCVTCSRARIRFHAWASKRDHQIFHAHCTGIEFFSNGQPRFLFLAQLSKLLKTLYSNILLPDAFDSHGDLSIRVVVPLEHVDRIDVQHRWREFGRASIKYSDDPMAIYLWAFAGMTGPACMDADDKAALRISLKGVRLVRTIGTYYAPLSKEELARLRDEATQVRATCPVCKDHELETIPPEHRHEESIESAESRYHQVEWGAEWEHLSVVRRGILTDNFDAKYSNHSAVAAVASVASSPPPW